MDSEKCWRKVTRKNVGAEQRQTGTYDICMKKELEKIITDYYILLMSTIKSWSWVYVHI